MLPSRYSVYFQSSEKQKWKDKYNDNKVQRWHSKGQTKV